MPIKLRLVAVNFAYPLLRANTLELHNPDFLDLNSVVLNVLEIHRTTSLPKLRAEQFNRGRNDLIWSQAWWPKFGGLFEFESQPRRLKTLNLGKPQPEPSFLSPGRLNSRRDL